MSLLPFGARSIMADRREPPDSLEFFPTPPWATRALLYRVLNVHAFHSDVVWEPCAGEGHMVVPLQERFRTVFASDIFDYGRGYSVQDFLSPHSNGRVDWVITNPPFSAGLDITLKALEIAQVGVAMLQRVQWYSGEERWDRLWRPHPPTIYAPFMERVPILRGRYDPGGGTATDVAWYVWIKDCGDRTRAHPIPYGQRRTFETREDIERFATRAALPLFEEERGDG